jgi:hypothetical protein
MSFMLRFNSANVRIANSQRAIDECLEIAFGNQMPEDCRFVIVNATLGHKLDVLAKALKGRLPGTTMTGSSCSGVTGRDGVGESMNDIAMMAISGPAEEVSMAAVREIYGHNSYEKGLELAGALKAKAPDAIAVYLLCPGIDIANDLVIRAFDETFGGQIVIFGGTASDNMRGLLCQQYLGDELTQHGAWAIAFSDPTLNAVTRATHGFTAYGEPMTVTKAEGNKIIELDHEPAWGVYTNRLGITPAPDTICGETIPIGALAEELPPDIAEEYGNGHILRVVTKYDADGTIYYATTVKEGLKLWLTTRDEDLIFSEQQRSLDYLKGKIGSGTPVAVFQTDCLARGRFLFNKVIKDEIIAMMHSQLSSNGVVPPWIGMYGFGEYTRLGGKNTYHNYSTALMALYR